MNRAPLPDSDPKRRAPVSRDWWDGKHRAIILLLVVAVSFLVAPRESFRAYIYSEDQLDRVAESDIVATHDFEYQSRDEAAIRQATERAADDVLPVWNFDIGRADLLEQEIHVAFESVRRDLSAAAKRYAGSDGSGDDAPSFELVPSEERKNIAFNNEELRALFLNADQDVLEEIISAFAGRGFEVRIETAIRSVVTRVMSQNIVEQMDALENIGASGITLRTTRGGTVLAESNVRHMLRFRALADVRDEVRRSDFLVRSIETQLARDAAAEAAAVLLDINTEFDSEETIRRIEQARAEAERSYLGANRLQFRRGEKLVGAGQRVDATRLRVLREMSVTSPKARPRALTLAGALATVLLIGGTIWIYARASLRKFSRRPKDLVMVWLVALLQAGLGWITILFAQELARNHQWLAADAVYAAMPFAAGAMLVRILTTIETALVFSVAYALLAGVQFEFGAHFAVLSLLASLIGSVSIRGAVSRTDILRAGLSVGLVLGAASAAFALISGIPWNVAVAVRIGASVASGLASAIVVYAAIPVLEAAFQYTTPMRLMELANLNHPLLKELILKAPGSYHHSMMVGQLVEAACEAVGADALLGRVGSYFHDVGKAKTPQYFAENQTGYNPHDKLKPHMSALVIKAHVKDGIEMARTHKLPEEIIDFIREHHGTSLIRYFFQKARSESDTEIDEWEYRYPGPKPRSRETAICMLADGIEAASRALPDPSPAHLKGLVQKMINRAFTDGQLDDCDLTLKDLHAIAQAFILRLAAFYHHRPEYPDARKTQSIRQTRRVDLEPKDGDKDAAADRSARTEDASGDHAVVEDSDEVHLRRLGL